MNQSPLRYQICRIVLLLFSAAFLNNGLSAQEFGIRRQTTGISGASSNFHQAGYQLIVQQSIGQAGVIGSSTVGNYSLRQGFIQPEFTMKAANDNSDLAAILFPNPFSDQFQIRFDDEVEDALDIQIFDPRGRAIFRKQFAAAQQVTILFPDAAAGIYLIHISTGKKQFSGRIQKLNL